MISKLLQIQHEIKEKKVNISWNWSEVGQGVSGEGGDSVS